MMPQQDQLIIEVSALGTLTDDQKAKLVECFKAGTILYVVQKSPAGVAQCVAASYADVSTTRTYSFTFGGTSLSTITVEETIAA